MAKRRKFSDEFKREAVRLASQSGVTKSQIGRELGIHANLLSRWCRDFAANGAAAFPGQGKPRDEEMAALKRELARVKKERDFYQKRRRSSRESRSEVPYDRALPRGLSRPHDVRLSTGVAQRLLRLARSPGEPSQASEPTAARSNPEPACTERWGLRKPEDVGGAALLG